MDGDSQFGARIGNFASGLVVSRLVYIINYGSNLEKLKDGIEKLVDVKRRVQSKVNEALRSESGKMEADKWVKRVDDLIAKAQKLLEDENHAHLCFYGLCTNFISRYDPSVKASHLVHLMAVEFQKGEELC